MTNQYIYTLHPVRPEMLTKGVTDIESRVLEAHVEYLELLAERAVVLLAGRTQTSDDSTFGIVILKADSESEAHDIMENDPAVIDGVMTARIFPYKISILSESIISEYGH